MMTLNRHTASTALAIVLSCCRCCVSLALMRQLPAGSQKQRQSIWIQGFPRSGSSTILSMLTAGGDAGSERFFSLFEPCHPGDEIELETGERILPFGAFPNVGAAAANSSQDNKYECPSMLLGLTDCNFGNIAKLWGWGNRHSSGYNSTYNSAVAADLCTRADVQVFKTVGRGKDVDLSRHLANTEWLLNSRPSLHMVEVVRDPRAIFASWKNTDPFPRILKERSEAGWSPVWKEACDTFSANLKFAHPQVHRVVFEDLVKSPEVIMRKAYKDLGRHFGAAELAWMKLTFADGCEQTQWQNYSDCQHNPLTSLLKWRDVLSRAELDDISAYEPCRNVFKAFNYPLS